MAGIRAAGIYARISSDKDGTAAGVERQLADCRKLAETLGWPVADEYVDNDVSAYSGKPRPQYRRMLADIEGATIDAVLVYHPDRLTRQNKELECRFRCFRTLSPEFSYTPVGGRVAADVQALVPVPPPLWIVELLPTRCR